MGSPLCGSQCKVVIWTHQAGRHSAVEHIDPRLTHSRTSAAMEQVYGDTFRIE